MCATVTPTPTATPIPTATATPTPEFPIEAENCVAIGPNGTGTFGSQNSRFGCAQNWQCARNVDGDNAYVFGTSAQGGVRIDIYSLDDVVTRSEAIERVAVHTISRTSAGEGRVATVLKVGSNPNLVFSSNYQLSSNYSLNTTTYAINPTTGQPWDWPQMNGLEAGVRHDVLVGEVRTTSVFVQICWVAPTPTATFTPSPSPTRTPTPTPTHTQTPLPSTTPTDTPSPTAPPTSTFTITPSRTPTSTVTHTRTATPTITETPLPSNTPTISPTFSVTPTGTRSPTPPSTATPTSTETVTPTGPPEDTATASPSATPTETATVTPSITGTRPTSTPTFAPRIPYLFATGSISSSMQSACSTGLAFDLVISFATRSLSAMANDDPADRRSTYKTVYISPDMNSTDYETLRGMVAPEGFLDRFVRLGGVAVIHVGGTRGDQLDVAPRGVDFISGAQHNSETIQEPTHPYFVGEGFGGDLLSAQDFSGWQPTDLGILDELPENATILLRNVNGPSLAEYPHGNGKVIVSTLSYCWNGRPNSDGPAATNLLLYGTFFSGAGQTPGPTVTPTPTATTTATRTFAPGTRTATPTATPSLGDLNGDGTINELDVSILIPALFDDPSAPRTDINNDGRVTAADVVALIRLIR